MNYFVNPIFITGCWHSGTRCMVSALDKHFQDLGTNTISKDFSVAKSMIINLLSTKYKNKKYSDKQITNFYDIINARAKVLEVDNGKTVLVKLPALTFLLDFIYISYPKSIVINVIRHGLDIICSDLGVPLPSFREKNRTKKTLSRMYIWFGKNKPTGRMFGIRIADICGSQLKRLPKKHLFASHLWNRSIEEIIPYINKYNFYNIKYEDLVCGGGCRLLCEELQIDDISTLEINSSYINRYKKLLNETEITDASGIMMKYLRKFAYK